MKKQTKKQPKGFYKSYDIEWLRKIGEEHPKFALVAEYDAKQINKNKK